MDDSEIVVLDTPEEELPFVHNGFERAPPLTCQRWMQSSQRHNPQRASTSAEWIQRTPMPPKRVLYPQPIITSIKSLSPFKNNQPLAISEVKSLSPLKNQYNIRPNTSYPFSKVNKPDVRSIFTTSRQPIITEVKSLSPQRRYPASHLITSSVNDPQLQRHCLSSNKISSSKLVPECVVLDDDDDEGNIPEESQKDLKEPGPNHSAEQKTTCAQVNSGGEPKTAPSRNCDNVVASVNPEEAAYEEESKKVESVLRRDETAISDSTSAKRKRIKPTPVVEDARTKTTIEQFMNACTAADGSNEMKSILAKKIMKHYDNCDADFLSSSSFENILRELVRKVETDKTNVYVHIAELFSELKARKAQQKAKSPPKKRRKEAIKEVDYEALEEGRNLLKIKKLSKTLTKLQKIVKQLESKEVSWEEDNDSAYIMLQRYKDRAVKVYYKLCEYTKESRSAGKIEKIHLSSGTRFPQVNKCVEKFVNSTGRFPDYVDILDLIRRTNSEENIKLSDNEVEHTAKQVFREVGEEMQRQRQHGVAESLLSFIESQSDPADCDAELQEKLNENASNWQKINTLIDDFANGVVNKSGDSAGEDDKGNHEDGDEDEDDDEDDYDDDESEEMEKDNDIEDDLPDVSISEEDSETSDTGDEASNEVLSNNGRDAPSTSKTEHEPKLSNIVPEEPDSTQDVQNGEGFAKDSGNKTDMNSKTACDDSVSSATVGESFKEGLDCGASIGLESSEKNGMQVMVKSEPPSVDVPKIRIRTSKSLGGFNFMDQSPEEEIITLD